jgi:hypothetical protein
MIIVGILASVRCGLLKMSKMSQLIMLLPYLESYCM